jgi:hypothetical protein
MDESKTLIERLRNPMYVRAAGLPRLATNSAIDNMNEAASELERAAAEIKFLRRILGMGQTHRGPDNDWEYHHMPIADMEETWKRAEGE